MPARNLPLSSAGTCSVSFTGTRCTILVKLPVPGSNGSSANSAPEAGDTLWTLARSATLNSSGGLHYDESLANHASGTATGYQYASWIEYVR